MPPAPFHIMCRATTYNPGRRGTCPEGDPNVHQCMDDTGSPGCPREGQKEYPGATRRKGPQPPCQGEYV